jgi:hypothetical protein
MDADVVPDVQEEWVMLGKSELLRHIEEFPASLAKADKHGCLPLHALLEMSSAYADDVRMMVEKYPAALQHQNNDGELPLHLACKYQCRSSIISICMELYPEGLTIANEDGSLPLHRLLWNSASIIEDALMMIEKEPRALRHEDRGGRLPIHVECIYRCRSLIITICVELYPESLSKADEDGYLPLHRLCAPNARRLSVDFAMMIIEKYPAALKCQNFYRYTPLHIECNNQCRPAIVKKCIELFPELLDDKTINIIVFRAGVVTSPSFLTLFSIVFTVRPMSLYDSDILISNDIRRKPTFRRRVLSLLPRYVFTPTHEVDYRDLNWQPRVAMIMLLSQMKMVAVS